jgi:hypothetical protein
MDADQVAMQRKHVGTLVSWMIKVVEDCLVLFCEATDTHLTRQRIGGECPIWYVPRKREGKLLADRGGR